MAGIPGRQFVALLWLLAPVCRAGQSSLQPASAQAEGIALLWWFMLWGSTLIFLAVLAVLGFGLWRAHRGEQRRLSIQASRNLVLAAGVAIPLAVLVALVGGSLLLGKSIALQAPDDALDVRITGWMWWWEIHYLDDAGQIVATTANELHVPVGRPIKIRLNSGDVIHSFWVPALHGKTDMVPGTENVTWFTADKAGTYRGQCAEFCGAQHALMAFRVVAQPRAEFKQWLAGQARPAARPDSERERRGQHIFVAACGECHRIRGTAAAGDSAPDLTHFASRATLAAVTRPNTRGHLGGWISDPQAIKPGNKMPRTLLSPRQHSDLLAYLESLE